MTGVVPSISEDWADFLALVAALRPDLHRYCAHVLGSIIDAEDVVQDVLFKAFMVFPNLPEGDSLRAWLFRIAHNRAIDLVRANRLRKGPSLEECDKSALLLPSDPLEFYLQQESTRVSFAQLSSLSIEQRCTFILKDVMGESSLDIAALLGMSVDAVKSHLARARLRLAEKKRIAERPSEAKPISRLLEHYVDLFNQRRWDDLRRLLAQDVKLKQADRQQRIGSQEVGLFFTFYAQTEFGLLKPAWFENREVVFVLPNAQKSSASYLMWLEWRNGKISFIHDYKYVSYLFSVGL